MSVNPLAYGQQFILQAPQPQPRPMMPQPVSPFAVDPLMAPMPMMPPAPLADVFSRQDEVPPALSKVGVAPEEKNDKEKMEDAVENNLPKDTDVSQPAINGTESSADGVVSENISVGIEGPIVLNLKSTTKDDLTIMAGQDLADLLKAAGPDLLDALKKTKDQEKSKANEKGKSEKQDGDKLGTEAMTIQDPQASVLAPVEPTPFAPKMMGFNTLM